MGRAITQEIAPRIDSLRLSVANHGDHGDCPPASTGELAPGRAWLTCDQIVRLVRIFVTFGVRSVRLTGNDPLARGDLPELAAAVTAVPGIDELSLTTNGTRLAELADELVRAGVKRVNVNVPTLSRERYGRLTGNRLEPVLAGLKAAGAAGLRPIKLNAHVRPDTHDDEIEDLIVFALEHGYVLRLIDDASSGRAGHSGDRLRKIQRGLARKLALEPARSDAGDRATYLRLHGTEFLIGFLAPFSDARCRDCSQVRVTADGQLHACLATETPTPLRPLLRADADDAEIAARIRRVIGLRPARFPPDHDPTTMARPAALTGG
jgi:cyclic pyranopterin phosphate synthase